jgi:hypothetical protein
MMPSLLGYWSAEMERQARGMPAIASTTASYSRQRRHAGSFAAAVATTGQPETQN